MGNPNQNKWRGKRGRFLVFVVTAFFITNNSSRADIVFNDLYTVSNGTSFLRGYPQVFNGQLCGFSGSNILHTDRARFWTPSSPSGIDLHPVGTTVSQAWGTNGSTQVGFADNHAYLWNGTADSAVDLNPSGYSSSLAFGIGGSQQVGAATVGEPNQAMMSHAILWNNTAASMVDLHPSATTGSVAYGTDGIHQVGTSYTGNPNYPHATLWSGTAESYVDLHPASATYSRAYGVGGSQQVGYANIGSFFYAFLWNGTAGSAVNLNPSGYGGSRALATDGQYQIGYAEKIPDGNARAMLWQGSAGSAVDLHNYLPTNFSSSFANSIIGDTIYGIAYKTVGTQSELHVVSWTVPEPSALSLMGCVGLILGRRRTSRRI